jgi:hypothetical protein
MAITPNINRQTILVAYVDIGLADIKTAGSRNAIWLPKGARVLGGFMDVLTASTDTGTHTVSVGDDVGTPDVDKYLAATNIKAAGLTKFTLPPLSNNGTVYGVVPAGGAWLTITSAPQNGDAGAGAIRVQVEYIIEDRVTEYETYRG